VPAGYVTTPVHGGARAMRTGIAPGGTHRRSYSPVEQEVTIPAGVVSARLRFWRYRLWGDAGTTHELPAPSALPAWEHELPAAAFESDFFYVVAVRNDGSLRWLLVERVHDPAWRPAELDLSSLRGETVRLQFGTYNNGTGGRSTTYLDDVSLTLCPRVGGLMLPGGQARRVIGRPESTRVYAETDGLLYRSDDAGRTWRGAGAGGAAVPMPAAPAILAGNSDVLYAGEGYPCYAGGPPKPFWRSTDAGRTWQVLPSAQNLRPLVAHSTRPWVYAAGCDGPYRSTDGGLSWQRQADPWFGLFNVAFLAPVEPDWEEVWAAGISEGGGGTVLVSRDGGRSWVLSGPPDGDLGWIGGLGLSRRSPTTRFVATVYDFWVTADDGSHWQRQSTGLEDVIDRERMADRPYGLFAMSEHPTASEPWLYMGTVRGLYRRDPLSLAWVKRSGQAFDDLPVTDLLILDADPTRIFVTTPAGVFLYGPMP
jgi:hypothetical protein